MSYVVDDPCPGERCRRASPLKVAAPSSLSDWAQRARASSKRWDWERALAWRVFFCPRCEREWRDLGRPYVWAGARGGVLGARCPCCAGSMKVQKEAAA